MPAKKKTEAAAGAAAVEATSPKPDQKTLPRCGLVMPISPADGYPTDHWSEVKDILTDAVTASKDFKFQVSMVSDADTSGLIHKRIVQNLYDCDIVICDVSSKNPNVMFELGMRLAFDRPIVLVKDSLTGFSFDVGVIEHLEYPSDLRFAQITKFKGLLLKKVEATHKAALKNPDAGSYLKSFATVRIQKLEGQDVSGQEAVLSALGDIQAQISRMKYQSTGKTVRHREGVPIARLVEGISRYDGSVPQTVEGDALWNFLIDDVDATASYSDPEDFERDANLALDVFHREGPRAIRQLKLPQ